MNYSTQLNDVGQMHCQNGIVQFIELQYYFRCTIGNQNALDIPFNPLLLSVSLPPNFLFCRCCCLLPIPPHLPNQYRASTCHIRQSFHKNPRCKEQCFFLSHLLSSPKPNSFVYLCIDTLIDKLYLTSIRYSEHQNSITLPLQSTSIQVSLKNNDSPPARPGLGPLGHPRPR